MIRFAQIQAGASQGISDILTGKSSGKGDVTNPFALLMQSFSSSVATVSRKEEKSIAPVTFCGNLDQKSIKQLKNEIAQLLNSLSEDSEWKGIINKWKQGKNDLFLPIQLNVQLSDPAAPKQPETDNPIKFGLMHLFRKQELSSSTSEQIHPDQIGLSFIGDSQFISTIQKQNTGLNHSTNEVNSPDEQTLSKSAGKVTQVLVSNPREDGVIVRDAKTDAYSYVTEELTAKAKSTPQPLKKEQPKILKRTDTKFNKLSFSFNEAEPGQRVTNLKEVNLDSGLKRTDTVGNSVNFSKTDKTQLSQHITRRQVITSEQQKGSAPEELAEKNSGTQNLEVNAVADLKSASLSKVSAAEKPDLSPQQIQELNIDSTLKSGNGKKHDKVDQTNQRLSGQNKISSDEQPTQQRHFGKIISEEKQTITQRQGTLHQPLKNTGTEKSTRRNYSQSKLATEKSKKDSDFSDRVAKGDSQHSTTRWKAVSKVHSAKPSEVLANSRTLQSEQSRKPAETEISQTGRTETEFQNRTVLERTGNLRKTQQDTRFAHLEKVNVPKTKHIQSKSLQYTSVDKTTSDIPGLHKTLHDLTQVLDQLEGKLSVQQTPSKSLSTRIPANKFFLVHKQAQNYFADKEILQRNSLASDSEVKLAKSGQMPEISRRLNIVPDTRKIRNTRGKQKSNVEIHSASVLDKSEKAATGSSHQRSIKANTKHQHGFNTAGQYSATPNQTEPEKVSIRQSLNKNAEANKSLKNQYAAADETRQVEYGQDDRRGATQDTSSNVEAANSNREFQQVLRHDIGVIPEMNSSRGSGSTQAAAASHSSHSVMHQVIERIQAMAKQMQSAQLRNTGNWMQAKITLRPQQLGAVLLNLRFKDNTLQGKILTGNIQTKQTIEKNLPAIHDAMARQHTGISDIRVEVRPASGNTEYSGFQREFSGQQSQAREQQTSHHQPQTGFSGTNHRTEIDPVEVKQVNRAFSSGAINYYA